MKNLPKSTFRKKIRNKLFEILSKSDGYLEITEIMHQIKFNWFTGNFNSLIHIIFLILRQVVLFVKYFCSSFSFFKFVFPFPRLD